ncbi:Gfo/Idh/MocA family protein [Aureimonas sp. AU4]|uniref:Gfo/Idh/MocA family protein n=1 Tax=Aureimonas sp. AU4 TaxID=1638163 RepID=UPI000706834F|nr:Gfo/Idh/MocA family oxidoreductase [Aureimonas sp. AU4]BAT30559.1 oxidoreductase, Gfo/Idh/MocA family protein [Aureimonas sp. AU4]
MASGRLGLAVIGTGVIARRFAADLRYSRSADIVSVGARDPLKAKGFAAAIGSGVTGAGIEAAMAMPQVGAVYIATANAVHVEHAMMAIRLGKSVLVEKPLAVSLSDAERLVEVARSAGVFMMEAMWARFTPGQRRLKEIADSADLGATRRLHADIAYFDPNRNASHEADGALLDLGIYPISIALHLLGPVSEVLAAGRRSANGVIERAELVLRHGDVFSCLSAAWDADGMNRLSLVGAGGTVEAAAPLFSPPFLTLRRADHPRPASEAAEPGIQIDRQDRISRLRAVRAVAHCARARRIPTLFKGSGLQYQVDHMVECLRDGLAESPVMPSAASLAALGIVEAASRKIV